MNLKYETWATTAEKLSGCENWEWGENASFEDCVTYVFKNGVKSDDRAGRDAAIAEYLTSVGDDPNEYGVGLMKTKVNEIKSARILSKSPLVLNVTYLEGGSDTFTLSQMRSEMTACRLAILIARLRVYEDGATAVKAHAPGYWILHNDEGYWACQHDKYGQVDCAPEPYDDLDEVKRDLAQLILEFEDE
jgi:hypothetical protein